MPVISQEQKELTLKTEVSEATVFINEAQIIRIKSVELLPGKSTIKFTGLSPYKDSKSVHDRVGTLSTPSLL